MTSRNQTLPIWVTLFAPLGDDTTSKKAKTSQGQAAAISPFIAYTYAFYGMGTTAEITAPLSMLSSSISIPEFAALDAASADANAMPPPPQHHRASLGPSNSSVAHVTTTAPSGATTAPVTTVSAAMAPRTADAATTISDSATLDNQQLHDTDVEDDSAAAAVTMSTDNTGSARQDTVACKGNGDIVDLVSRSSDAARTTTTTRSSNNIAASLDRDLTSNDDLNDNGNDHVAATTTTTELSNSRLGVSTDDTDKDGSAYVEALLSAIATVPYSSDNCDPATTAVAAAAGLDGDAASFYRLPDGEVVTAKNTVRSHSTAAVVDSNGTRRNSDIDHRDEDERPHARGVPVPATSPSASTSPILVNVVHATQDHAGTASSSPQPILAAVVSDPNEPIDHGVATTMDNNASTNNGSRFKKVRLRVCAVALLSAILVIVITLVSVYRPKISVTVAPSNDSLQSRASAVTNYINSIKFSFGALTIPASFSYQNESSEQAALNWLVNNDPLQLTTDSAMNQFRLQQRYALFTLFLQFPDLSREGSSNDECEWSPFVANCTESAEQTMLVVTEVNLRGIQAVPGSTLSPDLGLLSNLVTFRVDSTGLTGSLPSSLGASWTNLATFDVSYNALTGTIPNNLASNWNNLQGAYFYKNSLVGSMPSGFCNIISLFQLRVDCTMPCSCCDVCCTAASGACEAVLIKPTLEDDTDDTDDTDTAFVLRINTGSYENYTDHDGNTWIPENAILTPGLKTIVTSTGVNDGGAELYTVEGDGDIFNLRLEEPDSWNATRIDNELKEGMDLYRDERFFATWGEYNIIVPQPDGPGTATILDVTLYFCELWFDRPGQRLFQVYTEGQPLLGTESLALDLVAMGNGTAFVAIPIQKLVEVFDGQLTILFESIVEQAKISAIEVRQIL